MIDGLSISDSQLQAILLTIKETYGYDFRDYSKASMHRRISKWMIELNIISADQLIKQLQEDSVLFANFLEKITVNVTEMFRDPEYYKTFSRTVIPRLASYPTIKIWVAGCATGEEVFSIAILLHEAGLLSRSRIYATDINPVNLEKARKGIIPLSVMKEYTTNYIRAGGQQEFASYYVAKYQYAIINKELRSRITFLEHNLVTDEAFNEFQFVCCRNVIIYFNKALQDRVLQLFYNSLSSLGYLVLGLKESLLFSAIRPRFETIDAPTKIFRKIK